MRVAVVLADANVLFSRVLRDYVMYAALDDVIELHWSGGILDEMERNLAAQRKMPAGQAAKLRELMEQALPFASVQPDEEDYAQFAQLAMPDEGDRHVVAAAVAAGANLLCTSNTRHFPQVVAEAARISVVTPDDLLRALVIALPDEMVQVHEKCVAGMKGATSASTFAALERAGAPRAAKALRIVST